MPKIKSAAWIHGGKYHIKWINNHKMNYKNALEIKNVITIENFVSIWVYTKDSNYSFRK